MIENALYFVLSCFVLALSAIFLVKSLSKIACFLGISEFSAAFIIMAFSTSLPELFVGISSALLKNSALSLGNIIGASIIDITLIIGIFLLLSKEIKVKTKEIDKDLYSMIGGVALLFLLYLIGNSLSRIDGIFLILFFFLSIYKRLLERRKYKNKIKDKNKERGILVSLLIFVVTLIILFCSSKYAVKYASLVAIDLNLPKIIIGLFLLSIATTLPELVFGIAAIKLKHGAMSIGDQTGTVLVNSTFIIGLVAIIYPIKTAFMPFLVSGIFLIISSIIFSIFVRTGKKLRILEGISLILIYVLFIIIEFFIR